MTVRIRSADRTVEGPVLEEGFESFVGQYPIPMRHGMTIGELALLFNQHFGIGAKLEVVKMRGWSRDQHFTDTGLPFVLPSPNVPTVDTCLVFPGGVLLEGTNVSEGRGTTKPFELVGAPWVDRNPERFAAGLNSLNLPGVYFRPTNFEPTFHKHAKVGCGGCQIHVTDRASFRPVAAGVAVLEAFRRASPDHFEWRPPPYEYEYVKPPIDVLYGSAKLREGLEQRDAGSGAGAILGSGCPSVPADSRQSAALLATPAGVGTTGPEVRMSVLTGLKVRMSVRRV